jgi:UDP-GlcNAc:undecaprenyl-phosphate GlcNAc-1-phosphate transferase
MISLVLLAVSLSVSVIFTLISKTAAEKLRFFDMPEDGLKNHPQPVPYAGTSIWLGFTAVLVGLRLFTSFETGTLHQLRGLVFGGTLIFAVGLLDDILDIDYRVKFLWQVIAAMILVRYDIYIKFFPDRILNIIVSIFWVVLVVNSVNIIDILDGLSCGVSAVCALGFFAITLPTEQLYVNFAAIILFGILSGFWIFNKPRAKVFMGDAGSLFAGFILAALSMGADYSKVNIIGLFSPFLILSIPLYDTILVSYFRWRRGKPIFKGSKDHYALRLSAAGLSVWQIDIISYAVSLVLALSAFLITVLPAGYAFFILIAILFLGLVGSGALENINPHQG